MIPTQNFGIVIENNGIEILDWFKEHKYDTWGLDGFRTTHEVFWVTDKDGHPNMVRCHKANKNIKLYTLKEIQDMEKSKFPEKWIIRSTPETYNIITDWFRETKDWTWSSFKNEMPWGFRCDKRDSVHYLTPNPVGYTEITFEQFKQHVLNQTKEMKEIIGYKLKDEFIHLKEAVVTISEALVYPLQGYWTWNGNPISIGKFTKAGVLDLWFEPVYKQDEFKIGDWVIGWHSSCSIYSNIPWKIIRFSEGSGATYVIPQETYSTSPENIRLATTEETKAHLVNLAKQKGFVEGLSLGNIQPPTAGISYEGNIQWQYASYAPAYDRLTMHGVTIYKDGIWATIKPQEETVSVGNKFDVKIKEGKIYHKSDDITTFVKDMIAKNNATEAIYGNNYKVGFKDIIFSFTGCEKHETKLSDWQKVLDTYNKIQNG